MTEAGWLAATNPQSMLAVLRGKASDRKSRLFACRVPRRITCGGTPSSWRREDRQPGQTGCRTCLRCGGKSRSLKPRSHKASRTSTTRWSGATAVTVTRHCSPFAQAASPCPQSTT